jgi:hypothetical protein
VTEEQKRILKNITKLAAYTAMTGGAYFLAKGALSLLLKQLETKTQTEANSVHDAVERSALP